MNESEKQPQLQQVMRVQTKIEEILAVASIVAERDGRHGLRTFCLMLSAIETRGGLEEMVKQLTPQITQFLGGLIFDKQLSEWPEAIEFDEEQEF